MRIRQVKPAFWTDARLAKLSYPARLFYIGLWNLADDAGWLDWEPEQIGAELFPYETPGKRLRHIITWQTELVTIGRLVIEDCGCARIPTLPEHQRIAGKQSFTARDKHREHGVAPDSRKGLSVAPDSPVEVGRGRGRNVEGRNVEERNGSARDQDHETEFQRKVPRPTLGALA